MPGVKRILVACGTGIATSTMVADKVAEACRNAGIQADIIQCKAIEVPSYSGQGIDLIVTTTPVSTRAKIPVVNALPYLTGIGAEEVSRQIVEKLKGS